MRRPRVAAAAGILASVLAAGSVLAYPAALTTYYAYFDTGPASIPYADTRWVPQGLTKLTEDILVASYYDRCTIATDHECAGATKQNTRVVLISRTTGARIRTYHLSGYKGHAGGLAMTASYLWVASDGVLRRYLRSDLTSKADGSTISAGYSKTVAASSYAYAQGENVWVGSFTENKMYRYTVLSSGALSSSYVEGPVTTPAHVQGVIVTSTKIVYSRSHNRDYFSILSIRPRSPGSASSWDMSAPNMSEGMVIANGEVQVIFESCSNQYNGTADGDAADYIVRSIHHGPISSL